MMRFGVVDFVAFSGVCKSWRSFALCNRKMFMASKQPMSMYISTEVDANEKECCLKDFEGRKFKTLIPHSVGSIYVGLTCGYLALFGNETKDFWLVNPITMHQLHFPDFPDDLGNTYNLYERIKVILVFSPSMSGWLIVMTKRHCNKIWFSIAGKGVWNHISTTSLIFDLHAFKGKIYTITANNVLADVGHLCEMRFGSEPKLIVLKTKNFPKMDGLQQFASYGENLYVVQYMSPCTCNVHKLDFGEMKLGDHEKTQEEFVLYGNYMRHFTAAKSEIWRVRVNAAHLWYFPHDCLNVNPIDE